MHLNIGLLLSPFAESADSKAILSRDITTTGPHQVTYLAGATGKVVKSYRTKNSAGFIVEMGDGRKIPIPLGFLSLSKLRATKTMPMSLPYQTPI